MNGLQTFVMPFSLQRATRPSRRLGNRGFPLALAAVLVLAAPVMPLAASGAASARRLAGHHPSRPRGHREAQSSRPRGHREAQSSRPRGHRSTKHAPSIVSVIAPWRLPSALSREGSCALPDGRVLLLGGLLSSGTSTASVEVLDTSNGRLTSVATLPSPTHDAGSACTNGQAFLFGGGESVPFSLSQAVTVPHVSASGASSTSAGVRGQLPQPRADDEAITVGRSMYVVGGYDGSVGDGQVLETSNGTTFRPLVTLPVAVRYGAVAAPKGIIYVFGGEAEQGGSTEEYSTPTGSTTPPPGQQVAVVQEIDTRTGTAKVIGSLPHAVQGAAAFVLGGHIFLAGGDSFEPGTQPSSGATVWSFDPSTVTFENAGHLRAPVSYAGVAVEDGTAWLIGGERDGVDVPGAQRVSLRSTH